MNIGEPVKEGFTPRREEPFVLPIPVKEWPTRKPAAAPVAVPDCPMPAPVQVPEKVEAK